VRTRFRAGVASAKACANRDPVSRGLHAGAGSNSGAANSTTASASARDVHYKRAVSRRRARRPSQSRAMRATRGPPSVAFHLHPMKRTRARSGPLADQQPGSLSRRRPRPASFLSRETHGTPRSTLNGAVTSTYRGHSVNPTVVPCAALPLCRDSHSVCGGSALARRTSHVAGDLRERSPA